jgi:hypothetical protein
MLNLVGFPFLSGSDHRAVKPCRASVGVGTVRKRSLKEIMGSSSEGEVIVYIG